MTLVMERAEPDVQTDKRVIDGDAAVQLLLDAAVDRGMFYIDTTNSYLHMVGDPWADEPATYEAGCIVGWVLHALGTPVDRLSIMPFPYQFVADWALERMPATFTDEARRIMSHAMEMNDAHVPWGLILEQVQARRREGQYAAFAVAE